MKRILSLFLFLSVFTFVSCEEEAVKDPTDDPNVENPSNPDDGKEDPDDPEKPQDDIYSIIGAIQKGPFVQGSSITISELDDDLNSTGVNYQTVTTDDTGSFEIGSKIKSRYVEITANGYYFNEVSGKISSSELTLRTISDLEAGGEVNVNLLTSLANAKLKSLIKAGGEDYTFEKALKEAETCVLDAFGLERSNEHFDKMDITEAGDANAMLLAVSVTMQGDRSVGEMSELIAKIGAELESAGEIKTTAIQEAILQGAVGVDLEQVRENLNKRYSDLGADCEIPAFENFIDSDGNGKVDSDEAWLLLNGEKEYNIDYLAQEVKIEIENNIDYEIEIDYNGTAKWLSYSTTPTSRADIEYETITFSAQQHTGGDSRTATITFINSEDEDANSEITISQSPKDAIVLGQELYSVKSSGQIIDIEFASNVTDYTIEIPANDRSWIKVGEEAGYTRAAMEDYATTITVLENSGMEPRTSQLTIRAGEAEDKITIEQSGEILLNIDQDEIECSGCDHNSTTNKNAKVIEFKVEHNTEYTIDWDDNNECWNQWQHSLHQTEGGVDTYHISMPRKGNMHLYGGTDPGVLSQATIVVRSTEDETAADQVVVTQWPRGIISYDDIDIVNKSINNESQIIEYVINSNVPFYGAEFDAEWLTLIEQTTPNDRYSDGQYKYKFQVSENSGDTRSVRIAFVCIDPVSDLDDATLTQSGPSKTLTINNENAGELHTLISDSEMLSTTELVITGMVNADDFANVINPMTNLLILDLSGARFENDYMNDYIFEKNRDYSAQLQEIRLPATYDTSNVNFHALKGNIKKIDFGATTTLDGSLCKDCTKLETVVMNNVKGNLSSAFAGTALKSIVVSEGVTTLSYNTFGNCTQLESVKLPSTLTLITSDDSGVFEGCTALKSIDIPANVEVISGKIFVNCTSLESINFAENTKLKEIHVSAGVYHSFSHKTNLFSMFEGCTSLKSITIPASVESITGPVFRNSYIEEVIFESNSKLTTLAGGNVGTGNGLQYWTVAVVGCFQNTPIKNLTLPESLVSLGNYALCSSNMEEITLPNVREMGRYTFAGAAAHTISLPSVYVVKDYAFAYTPNLKTLDIPNVYELGDYALTGSGYIENNGGCFASDNIVVIGSHALEDTGVTSLDLPNLEETRMSAFEGTPLTTVSLPNLKIAGSYLFKDCVDLVSVSIPKIKVRETGCDSSQFCGVFSGCVNLDFSTMVFEDLTCVSKIFNGSPIKEVTQSMFPNATKMEYGTFEDCENLTNVDLPNIASIAECSFMNCTSLENITLEEVTFLPEAAFARCTKLKSVSFPKLTEIHGDINIYLGAFEDCTSLESFDFKGVKNTGSDTFKNCTSLSTITNIEDVTQLGDAFMGCSSLKNMPDWAGLTEIGFASFENCGIEEFSASNVTKVDGLSFDYSESLKRISLPKATSVKLIALECYGLETIEIGTQATSPIEYLHIKDIPYSRTVTLTIGEYDPEKVSIDGNTLKNEWGGSVTFKEIIVVDNIQ